MRSSNALRLSIDQTWQIVFFVSSRDPGSPILISSSPSAQSSCPLPMRTAKLRRPTAYEYISSIDSPTWASRLAIKAFKDGLFPSKKSVAKAYDVPENTFRRRLAGVPRSESDYGNKLSRTEESTLSDWALDMSRRILPLRLQTLRRCAELILSERLPHNQSIEMVGHWVTHFVHRHPELASKYSRKYDYQRAKCENPDLIQAWFARVQETIRKYNIATEDIYNMDETGFQMGVGSTSKVVWGVETKQRHARSIQPGNREWVTVIVSVNAAGRVLPPQIIFAAAKHQSRWFHGLPRGYATTVPWAVPDCEAMQREIGAVGRFSPLSRLHQDTSGCA